MPRIRSHWLITIVWLWAAMFGSSCAAPHDASTASTKSVGQRELSQAPETVAAAPSDKPTNSSTSAADGGAAPRPNTSKTKGTAPPTSRAMPPRDQRVLHPFEGVTVRPDEHRVELASFACLEVGYLEQIACTPETREHESLVVITAKPSEVHAALLLAGFEPGRPGRWNWDEETDELSLTPPRGDAVEIRFRYDRPDGRTVTEPVRRWIRSDDDEEAFPDRPWIFAGSEFRENPEWMRPGEHYVADMTGSIIGLVTFGDEVIGFPEVIADQAAVHAPVWVVDSDHVPPIGAPVTVIMTPAEPASTPSASEPE